MSNSVAAPWPSVLHYPLLVYSSFVVSYGYQMLTHGMWEVFLPYLLMTTLEVKSALMSSKLVFPHGIAGFSTHFA